MDRQRVGHLYYIYKLSNFPKLDLSAPVTPQKNGAIFPSGYDFPPWPLAERKVGVGGIDTSKSLAKMSE